MKLRLHPDVRRPLYRAAASAVEALSDLCQAVSYFWMASNNAFDEIATVLNGKADMDDPDIVGAVKEIEQLLNEEED